MMQSLESHSTSTVDDSPGRGEEELRDSSSSHGGDEFHAADGDDDDAVVSVPGGGGTAAHDDILEETYLTEPEQQHHTHTEDEDDENMLAARLGLQLAEENSTLRQRLRAARSSLAAERECREDLEEQLASLSRQHTVSVQQRLKQQAQHEELVSSFQEKESANTTTIADLTRKVAALEARCVAAAEAAYLGEGAPSSLGQRHNALTPEQVRQSRLQRLERELEVTNADLQELHNQLAVSEGQVRRLQTKAAAAEQARAAEEESGRVLREELVRAQEELENLLVLQDLNGGADVAALADVAGVGNRSRAGVPLSASNRANTKGLAASTSSNAVASVGTNTSLDLVTISRAELRELEITKQLRDQSPASARNVLLHDDDDGGGGGGAAAAAAAMSPAASLALGGLNFDGTPPVTPSAGTALGNCLFFETSFHSMPGDLSMAMRDEDTPHSQAAGALENTPGTAAAGDGDGDGDGKDDNNSHSVSPAASSDKENRVTGRGKDHLTPVGTETSRPGSNSDGGSPAQHENASVHQADNEIENTGGGSHEGGENQHEVQNIDSSRVHNGDETKTRSSSDSERQNATGGSTRSQAKFQLSTPPQLQLPAHILGHDSAGRQQQQQQQQQHSGRRQPKHFAPPSPSSQTPLMRRLQLENTLLSSQLKRTRRIIAATAAAAAAAAAAQTVRNPGPNTSGSSALLGDDHGILGHGTARGATGKAEEEKEAKEEQEEDDDEARAPETKKDDSAETRRRMMMPPPPPPRAAGLAASSSSSSSSVSNRECVDGNGPTVSWLQDQFAMQQLPPKAPSAETMAMLYVVGAWICCCFLLV